MRRHFYWLMFILLLAVPAFWISLPDTPKPEFLLRGGDPERLADCLQQEQADSVDLDCEQFEKDFDFSLGLDLVGGTRVLLRPDLPSDAYDSDDLREAANNVQRRIGGLGLTEVTVQVQSQTRSILVEIPGEDNPQDAIEAIQQTALLEFVDFAGLTDGQVNDLIGRRILTNEQVEIQRQRAALAAESDVPEATAEATSEATAEPDATEAAPFVQSIPNPMTGQPFETVITGADLEAAVAEFDGFEWTIRFELTGSGADIFGNFTASRIGQPLAIVLDGEVLSAPVIQARLTNTGTISGAFTEDEAKTLALQLRSGALPIPLAVESAETVGATLGQESVELSVRAGVVGVIVVLAFMVIYYRVPGTAADLALVVFIVLNVALFKLLAITLTLPAITGFLISIGTAVDGNILIFERLKEEVRNGQPLDASLAAGFERAWTSIRDSNISTIIICGILFLFGQTPGASIVSGFAITLALGLLLNLFTAVLVTRTFLYIIVHFTREQVVARKWLLGV